MLLFVMLCLAHKITDRLVVTSGRFTDDAVSFASGRNVALIDGPKLRGLLQQAKTSGCSSAPVHPEDQPSAQAMLEPAGSPECPVCSKPMLRRIAKRGANTGGEFWGCTGYPACRGTRPIR
ncbi:MAG: topoisomerase DNA-binding C4 zinc finger domain-containing protein [Burkholderiales bacterium]|nr:topoisomerase DNA-binding C4 zinc finger domain-containing protein [Burkholderiales bacterium]